ncbi:uncharacterized protein [Montipora capricornis]|uniref:uncharacterized protein n=1 Tax=Montipora capricornis TaxID=246305 RepID=UPI0035F18B35
MALSKHIIAPLPVYTAGTEENPSFEFVLKEGVDTVWLVTNPRLYFPLDQNLPPSTRRRGVKNPTSKVCLWTTDVISLIECFTIKPISVDVCQLELKDSESTKHAAKEVQARLRDTSHKWQKTSVPQCKGGLSLMEVSTVVQAVIVYMKDHYPTTPEEFNFHAELKAACHWHWLDNTTEQPPTLKTVPYDDCRLKIAAKNTLKTWEEELKVKEMDNKDSDSSSENVGERLSDLRQGIYVLKKHFDGDIARMSHQTEPLIKRCFTEEERYSPAKARKADDTRTKRRSPRLQEKDSLLVFHRGRKKCLYEKYLIQVQRNALQSCYVHKQTPITNGTATLQ